MENERKENPELENEQPQEVYVPRPAWQIWGARIGVVVVIVCFLLYLYHIATGGAI
jgi:hypothetical protein